MFSSFGMVKYFKILVLATMLLIIGYYALYIPLHGRPNALYIPFDVGLSSQQEHTKGNLPLKRWDL